MPGFDLSNRLGGIALTTEKVTSLRLRGLQPMSNREYHPIRIVRYLRCLKTGASRGPP